jgi:hypothetical protein
MSLKTIVTRKKPLAFGLLVMLLSACSSHYVTTDMIVRQLPHHELHHFSGVVAMEYEPNGLKRILSRNADGDQVYVSVDQNSQLIITDAKGESHKLYLDTAFVCGDSLHGLRSRFLGLKTSVPLNDIKTIEVYSEFSRETPADNY